MKEIMSNVERMVGGAMANAFVYGIILWTGYQSSSRTFVVLAIIHVLVLYGVIKTTLRPLEWIVVGSLIHTCICLISNLLGLNSSAIAQFDLTMKLLFVLIAIYLIRKYFDRP